MLSKIVEDIMKTASVAGTLYYRSPEYCECRLDYKKIRAADTYAAGLMFHEMIEAMPGMKLPTDELFQALLEKMEISADDIIDKSTGRKKSIGQILWKGRHDYPVTSNTDDTAEVGQVK